MRCGYGFWGSQICFHFGVQRKFVSWHYFFLQKLFFIRHEALSEYFFLPMKFADRKSPAPQKTHIPTPFKLNGCSLGHKLPPEIITYYNIHVLLCQWHLHNHITNIFNDYHQKEFFKMYKAYFEHGKLLHQSMSPCSICITKIAF